jgi:hypothetical protein
METTQKPVVWKLFDNFKAYTESKRIANKIAKITNNEPSALYFSKTGKEFAWDFIVPSDKVTAVRRLR